MAKNMLYALLGVALVMGFHFWPQSNSMFLLKSSWDSPDTYISVNYLNEVVRLHQTEPSFATRPVTTWFVSGVSFVTGLQPGISFIVVSFFLLFISFLALLLLSQALHGTSSLLTSLAYTFTFSVFFAWFPNIYTYDEPLQYTFLFLSLLFLQQNKLLPSVLAISIAVFVRENSLFVVPGYLYIATRSFPNKKKYIVWVSGILILGILLLKKWLLPTSSFSHSDGLLSPKRLEHLYYNFQNREFTIETLFMPVLAILIPIGLLIRRHSPKNSPYVSAFLFTFMLNTLLVFFLAKAREARLFALPLLFVWPLLHSEALRFMPPGKVERHSYIRMMGCMLLFFTLAGLFCFWVYKPSEVEVLVVQYRMYAFVSLVFFITMFIWPKGKMAEKLRS